MAEKGQTQPIEIRFSGGMNSLNTAVDVMLRKKSEVALMVNVDLSKPGVCTPLKTLLPLNQTAGVDIHSLCVANGSIIIVDGVTIEYLSGSTPTSLGAVLSSHPMSLSHVGNWIFCGNGTDRKAIYLPVKTLCDWGIDIPTVAPTVAAGAAGNPDGTYSCYYRYRVTMPDGTLILSALSPATDITVTLDKIEWSGLVYPTYTGATSVQIDLFRTATSMAANHLVTTLTSPVTTFSDDLIDADLILLTPYSETGYYPPPDNPSIVKYYNAADRVFVTVGPDAFWSESGKYFTFLYSAAGGDYQSVNSVFLTGEDITAVKRIDENLYFGSTGTWRRLRGKTPSDWQWEDTMAEAGPVNDASAVETPWGIIHPGIDGTMWLFTGNSSRSILDEFVFTTRPGTASHATFDGRFYRLYYEDPDYPELVVDFLKYPEVAPRIVKSTRTATASFYDKKTGTFFCADASYIRSQDDVVSSIAMTIRTGDIPLDFLGKMGSRSSLGFKANTMGEVLTVTPYLDGIAAAPITITTAVDSRGVTPIPFGDAYSLSLLITYTGTEPITIEEPWLIMKDEG